MSGPLESSGFEGRLLNQRWRVDVAIGSGTFGVVHRGDGLNGEAVAIKLLHPQFLHHVETIARFWNEAEALRRLNHPNVLFLLDVGMTEDGVPFLVTELLTGETLRDLLDREGALPPDRAMRLLGPAAHALHHAHLVGVVHRDLKPENIFRVRRDGMGTTKILDFGVAKLLDTGTGKKLSQTGIMLGTMAYSPPEQMQGLADIDHRADQFGFAALMFEALTGRRPFPHSQPFQLFQAVMTGPRPRASEIASTVPRSVDAILVRGLEADRERRFRDVEEFYLELTKALTTPSYTGLTTTFSGSRGDVMRKSEVPPAASPIPAPVAPMPSYGTLPAGMLPSPAASPGPDGLPSARYRAVAHDPTRDEIAAESSAVHAGTSLAAIGNTTMRSIGAPIASASAQRVSQATLMEGIAQIAPPSPSPQLPPVGDPAAIISAARAAPTAPEVGDTLAANAPVSAQQPSPVVAPPVHDAPPPAPAEPPSTRWIVPVLLTIAVIAILVGWRLLTK